MSSNLNIVAMHQAEALREQIAEQIAEAHFQRAETIRMCQEILDILGNTKYNEWIDQTPDGNDAFYQATKKKLSELKK